MSKSKTTFDSLLLPFDLSEAPDELLVAAAQLLAAEHCRAVGAGADVSDVERSMERVFAPLWQRLCEARGNTVSQYLGVKAIYDCRPAGLWGIDHDLCALQRTLIDVLASVAKRDEAVLPTLLTIIASRPLCRVVRGKDGAPRLSNTPGVKLYRATLAAWAAAQLPDGSWEDLDTAAGLQRLLLFETTPVRDIPGLDYDAVIARAFRYYSSRVIPVDADGAMTMLPSSYEVLDLLSRCHSALPADVAADIPLTAAHLLRYAAPALDSPNAVGRLIARAVQARAKQRPKTESRDYRL